MRIFRADPSRRHRFDDKHLGFLDRLLIKDRHERPDFNTRMFAEDFGRIFNYANRSSRRLFDIVSNDEELIQRLLSNVQTRNRPNSVDKTVRDWVKEIAQSLMWFGTAYYFLREDSERGDVHVVSFSSNGVARLFGAHIQWVPKRTERHWDQDDKEIPREIRILDSAKVMRFAIRKPIKQMITAQNRTLAILDKYQFTTSDFYPHATHENPNPTNHFDFGVWRDAQDRALYQSTRSTGWNGRKYDSSKRSDFFDCHRLIRFRRNQLMLRDDILRQISAELSRVGKCHNAGFSVEISCTDELPSIKYLDELETRLTREDVGFTEIIEYCFER